MIVKLKNWQRPPIKNENQIVKAVAKILEQIKNGGDASIIEFSEHFDQFKPEIIALKPFEEYSLEPELAGSIKISAKRIERFAQFQLENGAKSNSFNDQYGEYGQRVIPIERVGAYIPAGRFPLISTALMTLIPAKVAGTKDRIACSASAHPAILASASLAGATKFIQIGGVQAIAALAFGFVGEKPVDLIVGPGNAWVNEAKKQMQSQIKIDGLAGPSELVALCDKNQPIEWLAMDALAQAEHDPMACSIIVSDNFEWLQKLESYLNNVPETQQLVENKQIELICANKKEQLVSFANQYAPEHLMLCFDGIEPSQLVNYGSLFIGANSAVALGDYISGPNHTLPTLGYAKQTGGLSVATFQKIVSLQEINDKGVAELSAKALPIASSEGLQYHAKSLSIRI